MAVRIRGIYSTALTHRVRAAGFDVVQASPPIRRRFDGKFDAAPYEAVIETTDDRQGVGVVGNEESVTAVTDLLREIARDTFTWLDSTPRNAIYDGLVTDSLGSGAVVALGDDQTGFLPYSAVDGYVDEGDVVRVQVRKPEPPWTDDRPFLDTDVHVDGGLARLVRGSETVDADVRDDEVRQELAQLTELLPVEPPTEWGVRWERAAEDADMDAMKAAVETAGERAERVEAALADAPASEDDTPRQVVAPENTTWVWFGRESRFALDESRREVTATIPGHHRTKAARSDASNAVDFVEAICDSVESFPTAAVLQQFGPGEGDDIEIAHGKPDGRLFTLGRGAVTEFDPEAGTVSVRRRMQSSGTYDGLGTNRERGDTAVTKYKEGRWWAPTTYRGEDGESKGTYVNVSTPVELFPDTVRYVDLHVDVVKRPDGTVERVDDDELDAAVEAGDVSEVLAERAREVAGAVERALGGDA